MTFFEKRLFVLSQMHYSRENAGYMFLDQETDLLLRLKLEINVLSVPIKIQLASELKTEEVSF